MRTWMALTEAARDRRRDWRLTVGFAAVLGSALAVFAVCFSLAWPALWGPLPYPNRDRIVALGGTLSWQDAEDLRLRAASIERIAVYTTRTWGAQIERQGPVDVVRSVLASGEFFDVLGVRGRIAEGEAWLEPAAARRLFGTPEAAVGRTLWLNAAPVRVEGVLPAGFQLPLRGGSPELFLALPKNEYCCERGGGLEAIALTRDRTRLAAELQAASNALAAEFPATNRDRRFTASGLREQLFGGRLAALGWMLGGALCLVGIAAANGAGLWMARWLRGRRDAAIRTALGAPEGHLAAVRAAEGALAGLLAGAVGAGGGWALLRAAAGTEVFAERLAALAVWGPAGLIPEAALAALGAGLVLGLVSALGPHWAAARRGAGHRAMSAHAASRPLRVALTAAQLAVTAVLAWTTIAVAENVYRLLAADRGFVAEGVLVAGIGIPEARYNTDEKMTGFHDAVIANLRTVPGVTAAAGGMSVPQGGARTRFLRDGQTLERGRQPQARIGIVSPELLPLLGVTLRRGRGFTAGDRWTAPRVALVNEAFVRTYLGDAPDPLREGLRLSFYNGFAMKPYTRFQVAGVVADTRNDGLLAGPEPQVFIPAGQIAMEGFTYFVKTTLPAAAVQAELREAVWRVDRAVQRVTFRPLPGELEKGLGERRALGGFGLLLLAAAGLIVGAGLYASLAAAVAESERELAVRAALGAGPARLAAEMLRWAGVAALLAAAVVAVAVPWVASRVVLEKAVLRPAWGNVGLCVLAMAVLAGAAALRPAWRAARVQPARVLRGG